MAISWASVTLSDGTIIGIGQLIADTGRNHQALNEKLQLLKAGLIETHHRVKNNFQTLSALVDLQMIASEGSKIEVDLAKLKLHTRSLAAVHDLLTSDSRLGAFMERMSAKDTLDALVPLLQQTVGAEQIAANFVEVVLVNELVTNAVKHGSSHVEMDLILHDHQVMLEVRDDGRGFPPGFDPATAGNMGMSLIEWLSRWDLQGETRFSNHGNGGCIRVTFPLPSSGIAVTLPA